MCIYCSDKIQFQKVTIKTGKVGLLHFFVKVQVFRMINFLGAFCTGNCGNCTFLFQNKITDYLYPY